MKTTSGLLNNAESLSRAEDRNVNIEQKSPGEVTAGDAEATMGHSL